LSALIVDELGLEALSAAVLAAAPRHLLVLRADSLRDSKCSILDARGLQGTRRLPQPQSVSAADTAYLMFTSGTTGVPKGVQVSCGNVAHFLSVMQARYQITARDRCSQFFELTFDLSVFDMFMAWGAGACLYSLTEIERWSAAKFVRDQALTVWFAVPSAIAFMARTKTLSADSLPSLRLSLFCGEALPVESAMLWRAAASGSVLENLYGPTEATVACLVEDCSDAVRITKERDTVAIGCAFPGMFAALIDEHERFVAPGAIGELVLSGAQLACGYWRDDALSAERFPRLRHPDLGERVFYRTGDLATQDAQGHFHFLGRTDNQVKIQGQRVELEEIDAHLQAITKVPCAAIAWPRTHGSAEGVVAFVSAQELQVDEIRRRLALVLSSYMQPSRIVCLQQLPLTSNGKTDRQALSLWLSAEQAKSA
jgi:amino acid adenylation domain-containing protein